MNLTDISSRNGRETSWRWAACGLLLLAATISSANRLVFDQTAARLMEKHERGGLDFGMRDYGTLEGYFGAAFALGAFLLGFVVDWFGPRIAYPIFVLLGSLAGVMTGFVRSFEELVACRIALGFFAGANCPCALKTIQAILRPQERALGNGIMQSGAAVGAIFTPLLLLVFATSEAVGVWRPAFWCVGALGAFWVVLWLFVVRRGGGDRERLSSAIGTDTQAPRTTASPSFVLEVLGDRRFWVLAFTVVAINISWQSYRAWVPLFLEEKHGYSPSAIQWITTAYYLASATGSLLAGFSAMRLSRWGLSIHVSQLMVFAACATLTMLGLWVASLSAGASSHVVNGPLLLGLLLLLGFASLGLFPMFYSFSQALTRHKLGAASGLLVCVGWLATYPVQGLVATHVERAGSYAEVIALSGLPPVVALVPLFLFWKSAPAPEQPIETSLSPTGSARSW